MKKITTEIERIGKALNIAYQYGQIDGDKHKAWVIDQMVRALCGTEYAYRIWVESYQTPLDDEEYYTWNTGIAP